MRREKNLVVLFAHSQITTWNTERTSCHTTAPVLIKKGGNQHCCAGKLNFTCAHFGNMRHWRREVSSESRNSHVMWEMFETLRTESVASSTTGPKQISLLWVLCSAFFVKGEIKPPVPEEETK